MNYEDAINYIDDADLKSSRDCSILRTISYRVAHDIPLSQALGYSLLRFIDDAGLTEQFAGAEWKHPLTVQLKKKSQICYLEDNLFAIRTSSTRRLEHKLNILDCVMIRDVFIAKINTSRRLSILTELILEEGFTIDDRGYAWIQRAYPPRQEGVYVTKDLILVEGHSQTGDWMRRILKLEPQ